MKLPILAIALLIIGCSYAPNQESLIKKALKENFVPEMDDPSSYEFVGIESIDTFFNKEYRKNIIEGNQKYIEMYSGFLSSDEDLLEMYQSGPTRSYFKEEAAGKIKEISEQKAEIASYQMKVDSATALLHNADSNGIVNITAYVKIRGNNKMGAKVLSRYWVSFDENMKFIQAKQLEE